MKKFIQMIAFVLVASGGGATAQQQPLPLLGNIDSLIASIKTQAQQDHYPGLMVSIVTRDSILFSGGFGYGDVEHNVKVTGSTLFSVASVTKVFTSLAIQKLIAEGRLRLDDELRKIAPEVHFENQWEASNPVRVVNLLEHTAGFDDVHVGRMINPSGKIQTGLAAVKYVENSLVCRWPPGKIYAYANPDYVVLGYLIEKLSGEPAYRYITKNILRPLNMPQAHFDTGLARANHAIGYKFFRGRFAAVRPEVLGGNGADGALAASADDMSHFLKNLPNNWKTVKGGFLPASALPDMETVHSTLAAKTGLKAGYALGNEMQPDVYKITFRRQALGQIKQLAKNTAYF